MAEPAGEFIPSPRSQDCSKHAGGWGRGMNDFEYIWYGNKSEDDYPEDACTPCITSLQRLMIFKLTMT